MQRRRAISFLDRSTTFPLRTRILLRRRYRRPFDAGVVLREVLAESAERFVGDCRGVFGEGIGGRGDSVGEGSAICK